MEDNIYNKDQIRKKAKRDAVVAVAFCTFGAIMFSALSYPMILDDFFELNLTEKIIYGGIDAGLILLCVIGGVLSYAEYYIKFIRPEKHPESRYSAANQKIRSSVHKRLPGKDIFDALERYKKRYQRNRLICISACLMLVFLIAVGKLNYEWLPLWIAVIVAVGIILIAVLIAGKSDMAFVTEDDLRLVIYKKSIDINRLNNDFLMATNHKLFDGIAILGMDYLVIYARKYCDIVNIKDITHAETFYELQKFDQGEITRERLRVYLSYNQMITMTMKNESEMELMANELGLRGLKVEAK